MLIKIKTSIKYSILFISLCIVIIILKQYGRQNKYFANNKKLHKLNKSGAVYYKYYK